jgi:saccharopine dehydrogenase-like NADP-dependent oxidoreductase
LKSAEIIVIGTGSIARGVAFGLSQVPEISLRVAIIGRSLAKASEIALLANARAAIVGTSVTCQPFRISRFKAAEFSKLFRSLKPKVILLAASIQSPWEITHQDNAWTKLISQGG